MFYVLNGVILVHYSGTNRLSFHRPSARCTQDSKANCITVMHGWWNSTHFLWASNSIWAARSLLVGLGNQKAGRFEVLVLEKIREWVSFVSLFFLQWNGFSYLISGGFFYVNMGFIFQYDFCEAFRLVEFCHLVELFFNAFLVWPVKLRFLNFIYSQA